MGGSALERVTIFPCASPPFSHKNFIYEYILRSCGILIRAPLSTSYMTRTEYFHATLKGKVDDAISEDKCISIYI